MCPLIFCPLLFSREILQVKQRKVYPVIEAVQVAAALEKGVEDSRVQQPRDFVFRPSDAHDKAGGTDAAVVVLNGHDHLEISGLGIAVVQKEQVGGVEAQGLKAAAVAVVNRRGPVVKDPGIDKVTDARERAFRVDRGVSSRENRRRHIVDGHCQRAGVLGPALIAP